MHLQQHHLFYIRQSHKSIDGLIFIKAYRTGWQYQEVHSMLTQVLWICVAGYKISPSKETYEDNKVIYSSIVRNARCSHNI